jgi:hypothetical protein
MSRRTLPLVALAVLSPLWATAPATHAAYLFAIQGGPSVGFGGSNANATFTNANSYFGSTLAVGSLMPGISGSGTPLNNGGTFGEDRIDFGFGGLPAGGYFGSNGHLPGGIAVAGFSGRIVASDVTATGGTFRVDGYLGQEAAAFFGIDAGTKLTGVANIQFIDPTGTLGSGNKIASVQLQLTGVPEPGSLVLVGLGVVCGAGGWVRRRWAA